MKLIKDGIILGDISNYREDLAFSPPKVHFDCRPTIHDADGIFNVLCPDGHTITISHLKQIEDGVVSHITAREVVQNATDSGEKK
jgi:hypothetical protein